LDHRRLRFRRLFALPLLFLLLSLRFEARLASGYGHRGDLDGHVGVPPGGGQLGVAEDFLDHERVGVLDVE